MLVVGPALSACGGRPGTSEPEEPGVPLARTALPGLVGRSCEYASTRRELPELSRIARVGTRGNIAIWGFDADPSDSVVVSVRYDDEGRLAWVRTIASSVPGDRVAPLEQMILESFNERAPPDWGVRIRVVGGTVAGLEPSVLCPAEPRSVRTSTRVALPITQRGRRALEQSRGRRFPVELAIDERGRITGARLTRSAGHDEVDQVILDWVYGMQFHPKLHDGIPLPSTLERTIYIPRRR